MSLWIDQEALLLFYSVGWSHSWGLPGVSQFSFMWHLHPDNLISCGLLSPGYLDSFSEWWLEDKSQCASVYQACACVTELANIHWPKQVIAKPRAHVAGEATRTCVQGAGSLGTITSLSLYLESSKTRVKIL